MTGFIISFIKKNADKDTIIVLEDLRQFSSIQTFVTGGLITTINKFLVKEYKLDLFHEKQLHYFCPNEWQRILGLVAGTQSKALKTKSLSEFHRFTDMNIIDSDDISDAYNIARYYVKVKAGRFTPFSEKRKQNRREEIQRQKQKERENNKYVLIYQPNYESMSKKTLANIVVIAQENLKSYMEFYKMEDINEYVDEKFILDILKTEKKEKLIAFINEKVESGYYYSIKNQAKRTFSIEQALQVPRYKLENVIIKEKLDKNFWKKIKWNKENK